jgi:hypothetical protein
MDAVMKCLCLSLNHGGHFKSNLRISRIYSFNMTNFRSIYGYNEFSTEWFISISNYRIITKLLLCLKNV